MHSFDFTGSPARVIFGNGASARVGEAMDGLDTQRALILCTPFQRDQADALAATLGERAAGIYDKATMHTPTDVTADAIGIVQDLGADCTIAIGGGSTTGLGKAIAYQTDLPQIVVATTYAGSEVTPILGQTENEVKTTLKSPKVLPEVVIYDPELTVSLPAAMTVTSALNAIAHAVEALYAKDRNPITSLMSAEGIRALTGALPRLQQKSDDLDARGDALYGAWLCGSALGTVGMALHHKLCHTLGGTFNLPHAETHAIVLPHATAFNEGAVPNLLKPVADALGAQTAGGGLYDYAQSIGAPMALKDLGMPEDGIDKAADLAVSNPYWNPRTFDRTEIRNLIAAAWAGERPAE